MRPKHERHRLHLFDFLTHSEFATTAPSGRGDDSVEGDLEFYTRRAFEERRAAERSLTPEARKTHLELAETYLRKAQESRDKADPA